MTDSEYNIDERASELKSQTILSERQAQVQALYEQGASRDEMATELDVTTGTVDSHRDRVAKKLHAAQRTVDEIGNDYPPAQLADLEKTRLPDVCAIHEDDWDKHPYDWDEKTPIRLISDGTPTFYVNMDSPLVRTETAVEFVANVLNLE